MLLFFFFILSILFSFLCSIWEAVLLSISPSFIQTEIEKKSRMGASLKYYKEDIDRPLSAILTLNTIAHTVGAIGVGAQAGKIWGAHYLTLGPFSLSYESIIAALMTLAILILSEIIPKTIGANNWKSLAPFTTRSLDVIMFLLRPFVWLSQLITKSLKKDKSKSVLSRADFRAMASVGHESGVLDQQESVIIKNLLKLIQLKVQDIMTPKTVVFMSSEEITLKELHLQPKYNQFSRIPIYGDREDNITGVVLKNEVLQNIIDGKENQRLKDISNPPQFVQENMLLKELFDQMIEEKTHLFIVVDEYGALSGVVTMEDLFETLLGKEIVDETDKVKDLRKLAKDLWDEKVKDLNQDEENT